jgi:serine/threonine protein kinase
MSQRSCLRDDELHAFLVGSTPPDEFDTISDHLDNCAACQARAESLEATSDPLLSGLLGVEMSHPDPPDPERERLLARTADLTPVLSDSVETAGDAGLSSSLTQDPQRVGDFEILRRLGSGGFGTVYLARGPLLQRLVAIKVLRKTKQADSLAQVRFLEEMRAIGRLASHPHVVQAFHAAEDAGTLYLVMEYVEGVDLERLARSLKGMATAHACEAVRQAAIGLQYIHEHKLVHRDVKPANLMVTSQGFVKVLDLGLARLAEGQAPDDRVTEEGGLLGTFDYMAPEQARDPRQSDIRADIYSLGCTLFRLLAGRVPFPHTNPFAKIQAHQSEPPQPLAEFRTGVPAALQEVVARMMAKEPADRFQTPQAVADALAPFCAGADLRALLHSSERSDPPGSGVTLTMRKPRRHRWQAAAVTALLLLAAGFLLGAWRSGWLANLVMGHGGPDGPVVALTAPSGPARTLAFAFDGPYAASADATHLACWDLERPSLRVSWTHGSHALAPSNVAFVFAGAGQRILLGVNDAPDHARLLRYDISDASRNDLVAELDGAIVVIATAPEGHILTAQGDGRIRVWDVDGRRRRSDFRLESVARTAAFSPDGRSVLYGCDDGVARLCDLEGNELGRFGSRAAATPSAPIAVGLSTETRRAGAASLADQTVRLWDTRSGTLLVTTHVSGSDDAMTCAAFAADCGLVLTGHQDGSVAVWDPERGECVARYHQHTTPVAAVALDVHRRRGLSAGRDDPSIWLHNLPVLASGRTVR